LHQRAQQPFAPTSATRIAIVGGGPTGYTLAGLLALRGIRSVVYDDGRKPELIVGESLLPAAIPIFQRLGIEDRVAAISQHKPGASFFHTSGHRIDFSFKNAENPLPGYAYNSPRPALDHLLAERARELGVKIVPQRAKLAFDKATRKVNLKPESLTAAGFGTDSDLAEQPALIIDATGRTRAIARGLDLPSARGGRDDVSYFAHFKNFRHDEVPEGQIIISALTHGWCWRIPLPGGRLSVGVVLDRKRALGLGGSPAERLEHLIATEPLLKDCGREAERVTKVFAYANYQWISEITQADGWLLAGDAFGFVDPMLSPGLFMGLESARLLDHHLFGSAGESASTAVLDSPPLLASRSKNYAAEMHHWHASWSSLIHYFYSGEIFQFYWAGEQIMEKHGGSKVGDAINQKVNGHINRQIAMMASGGTTRSRYSRSLLWLFSKTMVHGAPPREQFCVSK